MRKLRGFTIRISPHVRKVGEVLESLDARLQEILDCTPKGLSGLLREVPLWVEEGDASDSVASGERVIDINYCPVDVGLAKLRWLIPEKAGGIEIYAAKSLEEPWASWRAKSNPGWLLHEFAHALHDQVLGLESPGVKAAYELAAQRKLYDNVEMRVCFDPAKPFVVTHGAAYARSNAREYFAEISIAYFGKSQLYYPYSREDLRRLDVAGFELVDGFWRSKHYSVKNETPLPVSVRWTGENKRQHSLFTLKPGESRKFDGWARLQLIAEDELSEITYHFERRNPDDTEWIIKSEGA